VEQQQDLLVFRHSTIERVLRSRSARGEGLLELGERTLTCLFALIAIRQTQRSASHERNLAIHRLLDLGLEGVADQTGNQPTQRDVLLLSPLPQMVQKIVRQGNPNLRSCVHADPMSATSVAASAHCFVMSVVHSLFLQRWNLKEKSREPTQFEIPTLRYDLIRSPSTLTKPNHRANRTCR
jgi:hypothetical protein